MSIPPYPTVLFAEQDLSRLAGLFSGISHLTWVEDGGDDFSFSPENDKSLSVIPAQAGIQKAGAGHPLARV